MSSFMETRPQSDAQLEVVTDKTRRNLLIALLDDASGDTPIEITDRGGDAETADLVKMRHVHLPKLEDHGLVRWDRGNNLVRRGPHFAEIEPLLMLLHDNADELPGEWL